MDTAVIGQIVKMSQGLPHYVHLLGLRVIGAAAARGSRRVEGIDLKAAYPEALEDVSASIRSEYKLATQSNNKGALFRHVLLACAQAPKDEGNEFRAADVTGPLKKIAGRHIGIPQFAAHLDSFCKDDRGNVLEKSGKKRAFKYKFRNPLLEPYIVMQGITTGLIEAA